MGQKVSPLVLRIGINRTWSSRWFTPSKRSYVAWLQEDRTIRQILEKELEAASVSHIDIERSPDRMRILIHTARPGVLIGRRGENIQRLQELVQKLLGPEKQLQMEYVEVTNPYIEATLIAKSIAFQLEKRIAYRRAMKRSLQQAMESGAQGIHVVCKGRLGGSEMKRRESYRSGKVPLGTLRANIDFGDATAHTATGCIGLKVWVYKGDIGAKGQPLETERNPAAAAASGPPAAATAPAASGRG